MHPLVFALVIGFAPVSASEVPASEVPASEVSDSEVIDSIERSLPYLERGGLTWMDERGCVSCHHVPFMIWSHNDARTRGIRVDGSKVDAWTNRAFVSMLAQREEGGGADTMSQMLLGRDRASSWRAKPPRHFKTSDPYDALFEMLLDRQRDDGSWPPEGQLTTPPELSTGWALLALASRDQKAGDPGAELDPDDDLAAPLTGLLASIEARLPASRERGLAYLDRVDPHATNEGLVLRTAVANLFGNKHGDELRTRLLSRQNPDGGWSNLFGQPRSDAYATGQTLYGLSIAGMRPDHPALIRARNFLLRTQRQDGSWHVSAERVREGKNRESLDEIFSYWGTGWAAIGLLRTLPD